MKKSIFFLLSCLFIVTSATAQIGLPAGFAQLGQGIVVGTTTAYFSTWQNNYPYEAGTNGTDYVYTYSSANSTYVETVTSCVSAATGSGPSGTGTGITDGTCSWNYVAGGSQFIVPSNYIATISVEAIGGGGGGGNGSGTAYSGDLASGGGGAYAKITTFSTTPGTSIPFSAGLVGVGGAANGSAFNPGTSAQAALFGGTGLAYGTCAAAASVSAPLCADFGVGGNTTGGGTGGLAANSIGSLTYNGGSSGTDPGAASPGGGAAGGPNGAGANGGNGSTNGYPAVQPGSGGGGADGGSAGSIGGSSTGGNGGENFASTGAGIGTTGAGGNGSNGGGGAGSGTTGNAGNGGCGTDFDSLHGAGGGGGGATSYASAIPGNGACGGGGGSAAPGSPLAGGNGGNGLIAFKYQYCSLNCGGGNGGGGNGSATVTSITPSTSAGLLITGSTETFTVNFSSAVTVSGTPTLALSNGGTASYTGGNGTNALTFGYTVTSGQNTPISASTTNPSGNTYLGTSSSALSGTINGTLNTLGANSKVFNGLAVNTNPLYFIATTGSDSNACSKASPCLTLQHVQGLMQGGSTKTVYMRGGTYNGSVSSSYVSYGSPLNDNSCGGGGSGISQYGDTIYSVVCVTSSDNGEAYLGYPGETAVLDSGTSLNSITFVGTTVDGFTINGLTFNNYVGVLTMFYGDQNITMSNSIANNLRAGNAATSNEEGDFEAMFFFSVNNTGIANLYFGHNVCNNSGSHCFVLAGTTEWTGPIYVDGNIFINACSTNNNGDCGPISIWNPYYDMNGETCQISNNIIAGVYNSSYPTKGVYLDDYTSGCNVYQNQIYGSQVFAYFTHGGNLDQFYNNLTDMSAVFANSANEAQYSSVWGIQDATSDGTHNGYSGIMNGNTYQNNVIYSTVAPWTTSTCGTGCGYIYFSGYDSGIDSPAVSNNLYYATTGSFTHFTTQPGASIPVTDTSPITGENPLITTCTGTWGETHYLFGSGSPALSLSGMTQFQVNQGPYTPSPPC